jgi:hypothetical protein
MAVWGGASGQYQIEGSRELVPEVQEWELEERGSSCHNECLKNRDCVAWEEYDGDLCAPTPAWHRFRTVSACAPNKPITGAT